MKVTGGGADAAQASALGVRDGHGVEKGEGEKAGTAAQSTFTPSLPRSGSQGTRHRRDRRHRAACPCLALRHAPEAVVLPATDHTPRGSVPMAPPIPDFRPRTDRALETMAGMAFEQTAVVGCYRVSSKFWRTNGTWSREMPLPRSECSAAHRSARGAL